MRSTPVLKSNEDDSEDDILLVEANEADNNHSMVHHRLEMTQYTGPLPPAREFAAYAKTLPDAPERILTMAETQASHRQANETKLIEASIRNERRGQLFGFSIIFITIACGFYLAIIDKNPEGFGIIIGAAGGLAGLILWNRARERHDKKD